MKGGFLLIVLSLIFVLSGSARKSRVNLSDTALMVESPAFVLLGNNYNKRIDFIKELKSVEAELLLKSNDEENMLDRIVTTKWNDELSAFENEFRYEYSFGNEGRRVFVKIFEWESDGGNWNKTFELTFVFNNQDQLLQSVFEMFLTSVYKSYTKIDYSYSANRLSGETSFIKYEEDEEWVKDGQIAYHYNSNNILESVLTDVWDSFFETWVVGEKVDYIYDENGNLINETGSDWDEYEQESSEKYRIINRFDENNRRVESIEYIKGYAQNELEQNTRLVIHYDSKGEVVSDILYEWEFDQLIWLEKEKHEYSQNETDKLFLVESSRWIENSFSWEKNGKSVFTTINNYVEDDILYWEYVNVYLPVYSFNFEVSELVENYTWINNEWSKTSTTNYYFSPDITVGVDPVFESHVSIYPNPVHDFLTIKLEKPSEAICLLRDISGRIVLQKQFYQSDKVNMSFLSPGIYLLELRQNGKRLLSEKLLIH